MKAKLAPAVLLLAAALTANCLALTPILEKFNGSKLNSKRWFFSKVGKGKLVTKKGKLNFLTTKATRNDIGFIELLTSRPGFDENWEMTLDVSITSKFGRNASCGFFIFNTRDRDDYLFAEFFGKSGFSTGVVVDGKASPERSSTVTKGVSKGGLRISFNRNTRLLTLYSSANQRKQGYQWLELGSFSPTGKGGDVRANWKMRPSKDAFGIQLFGYGSSSKVPVGKITIDNFSISGSL